MVRPAAGPHESLAPSVRAAIAQVDKAQLVSVRSVMSLDDVAGEASARDRFRAILVMAFAGLALLLAMVGLFGILAYSVQRRVRDLGVRRALGATTGDVVRSVLGGAARVLAIGLCWASLYPSSSGACWRACSSACSRWIHSRSRWSSRCWG